MNTTTNKKTNECKQKANKNKQKNDTNLHIDKEKLAKVPFENFIFFSFS